MKKHIYLLAMLVFLSSACGSDPKPENAREQILPEEKADQPFEYHLRKFNVSTSLSAKPAKGNPRITLTLTLLETPESEFLKDVLYAGKSPEQYRDALSQGYTEMYQQNPPPEDLLPSQSFVWEHLEQIGILYLHNPGMVIEREMYTFTGGAHGMPAKMYYVIDLEQQKKLHLEDFFRDPGGAEVRKVIQDELRRYSGLTKDQPLSEGIFFEDEPEISGNFFVSPEGIGLHWNPYEIAPYYVGYVEIRLPWKAVRSLLNPEGAAWLTKFGISLGS
ncbi:MAG: RsiV family protein [Spirochaetaceae bacterium]|jgi:hypothetical protein|nr:RsiV family protein [Spirochaetaceae bacterium]